MPLSNKCLNHEMCKGYALNGEKFCNECRAAGYGGLVYVQHIPKHEGEKHGGRASKFPQNGKNK